MEKTVDIEAYEAISNDLCNPCKEYFYKCAHCHGYLKSSAFEEHEATCSKNYSRKDDFEFCHTCNSFYLKEKALNHRSFCFEVESDPNDLLEGTFICKYCEKEFNLNRKEDHPVICKKLTLIQSSVFCKITPPQEWLVEGIPQIRFGKVDCQEIDISYCFVDFDRLNLYPSKCFVIRDQLKWDQVFEDTNMYEYAFGMWETSGAYKFVDQTNKLANRVVFIPKIEITDLNYNLLKFCRFCVVYKVRRSKMKLVYEEDAKIEGRDIFEETYATLKKKYVPWFEAYRDKLCYVENEVEIIPLYHLTLREKGYYKVFDLHGAD